MQKSFILHSDQIEIFENLSDEDAGKVIKEIYRYANYNKPTTLTGLLKTVFIPFKTALDRNGEKYERVCERNRKNIEKRWGAKNTTGKSGIPFDTRNTDSDSKSDTDSDSDTDTKTNSDSKTNLSLGTSPSDERDLLCSKIITSFNKIGIKEKNFKKNKIEFQFENDDKNKKIIKKLLNKGYTEKEIVDVIYVKYEQWVENDDLNTKDMVSCFKPSTVLGSKFDEYNLEAKRKGVSD